MKKWVLCGIGFAIAFGAYTSVSSNSQQKAEAYPPLPTSFIGK